MEAKTRGLGSVFFVFCGYVLSVTAFVIGGTTGNQLTFSHGVLALFIGNMVLAFYAGIIGIIGMKSNRSSAEIFKPVFGIKGQVVAATIVSLFSLIFVSVYSSLVGNMASSLFGISPYIGLVVYLIIVIAINLKGFTGMSIFSKFGVPIIGAFVLYGMITVSRSIGFGNLSTAVPVEPASFFTVVSFISASWMTGATLSSDITRFVKKPRFVWVVTIGAFLCVTLLETVGLMCSLGTGQSDLVRILGDLNMAGVAFCIYILLTITSGQAVVFIAATALENITGVIIGSDKNDKTNRFTSTFFIIPSCIFAGVIGIFMTANGFTSTFSSLLGVIGIAIPPVGGALVGHFFLVEREFKKTFENMPDYRFCAFIAWILGTAISRWIDMGIKPLNGFIVSALVYTLIRLITSNSEKSADKESQDVAI